MSSELHGRSQDLLMRSRFGVLGIESFGSEGAVAVEAVAALLWV